MFVHLFLRETRENCTFVKLQCILIILHVCVYYVIICYLGIFCTCHSILVTVFQLLTKIHQNQFFLYFYGFKLLVWYNLVLCYSLDPVLVIWHVTLIIILQNHVIFSKCKKVSFGVQIGSYKIGLNSCSSHFYVNLC